MRCKSQLHNLAQPCKAPTAYGLETFKALAAGQLPKGPTYKVSTFAKESSPKQTKRCQSHTIAAPASQGTSHQESSHKPVSLSRDSPSDEENGLHPVLRTYTQPDYAPEDESDNEQLHLSNSRCKRQRRMSLIGLDGSPLSPVVSKTRIEYDSESASSCSDMYDDTSVSTTAPRQLTRLTSEQAADIYMRVSTEPATVASSSHVPTPTSETAVLSEHAPNIAGEVTTRHLSRMTSDEAIRLL